MQGYCHLNTTVLSDTYKYVNYMFQPLWPLNMSPTCFGLYGH